MILLSSLRGIRIRKKAWSVRWRFYLYRYKRLEGNLRPASNRAVGRFGGLHGWSPVVLMTEGDIDTVSSLPFSEHPTRGSIAPVQLLMFKQRL